MTEAVVAPATPVSPVTPEIPVFTRLKDIQSTATDAPEEAEGGETPQKPAVEAPAPEKSETTTEQPDKPGKNRFERRLDKAYRKAAEAQGRADFLEKQLAQLKQAPQPQGAPKLEDFSDIQEYAKAYAKYETEVALKTRDQTQAQEQARANQARLTSQWEAKTKLGDEKYEDFDEVVGDLTPNSAFTVALMQAENGHDIAHYLGKNLKEAERIISLDPISQIREIGRLEAKLLAEPPTPKAPSAAPAPIKPVGGASSASTKRLSDMTQDEFEKKRKAQIAARR